MEELINITWEIIREGKHILHITFLEDGYFRYTNIKTKSNEGKSYGGANSSETWTLEDNNLTLSFSDGYMIQSGTLSVERDEVSGQFHNKAGLKGNWSGRIKDSQKPAPEVVDSPDAPDTSEEADESPEYIVYE